MQVQKDGGGLEKRVYELVEYKDADKTELRKLINIYNNKKKNMSLFVLILYS